MPPVLWLPIGIVALGTLMGAYFGGRSTTSSAKTGLLMGFWISLMSSFPLLAIGLTTI